MELTLTRKKAAADGPFTPGQPRVNLVPPAALERAAQTRAQRVAIAAWSACFLAVAATFGAGVLAQQTLNEDLAQARAEADDLALELAKYAPVTSIAKQTQALKETVASQTTDEVEHDQVVDRFLAAVGDTMVVDTLQVATDGTGACVSTDPFQQVPLAGCITFSGQGVGGGSSAAQIIAALSGDAWFSDPFIPTVGAGNAEDGSTNFSGTVGLTLEARSAAAEETEPPTDPDLTEPTSPGTES